MCFKIRGQFPYSKVKAREQSLKLSVKWSNTVKVKKLVTMRLVTLVLVTHNVFIDDTFKIIY